MEEYGAEILLDICKFWASKSIPGTDGRFDIDKVMGPDEFHESLPGSGVGGLTNNAYSNIMLSWTLDKAFAVLEAIGEKHKERILSSLSLSKEALEKWDRIMHGLNLSISEEGVIEQFKGYFDLDELDWEFYRKKYGDIHRLDRILKAEGKSPDNYKLAKQADLLMSFYNFGKEEVRRIVESMGYKLPEDFAEKNFNYYIERTSHGSTLSRLVHARLAWEMEMFDRGWELYMDALRSDLVDIQGGTTGEGVHCGVMAGTVYDVMATFAGLDLSGKIPSLQPVLPGHWKGLHFHFAFKGTDYQVAIDQKNIKIRGKNEDQLKIKVHLCGEEIELEPDEEGVKALI
jgi:trehalose/maltose hydrolase-like predicted phosphorylase